MMSMKKKALVRKGHKTNICRGVNCSTRKPSDVMRGEDNEINSSSQLTHLYEEILAGLSWSA